MQLATRRKYLPIRSPPPDDNIDCTKARLPARHERKCMEPERESCVEFGFSAPPPFARNLGAHEVGMYRIELSPGEETVFRSIEELAVAVKRGVVTPRARIFHSASNKWLPIQFHPHYKAAVSMPLTQSALVAGPQVKPLTSLSLEPPAEPEALVPFPLPAQSPVPFLEPSATKKSRQSKPAKENHSRRRSKPRRQLRIALVGALLVGGAQWVLSASLFSRTNAPEFLNAHRSLIAVPAAAMKRVSSPNTAAMIPVLPSAAVSKPPAVLQSAPPRHVRVSAPSFGGTSVVQTVVAPEVEPAPLNIDPSASPLPHPRSLEADSTGKKPPEAMKH